MGHAPGGGLYDDGWTDGRTSVFMRVKAVKSLRGVGFICNKQRESYLLRAEGKDRGGQASVRLQEGYMI